MSLELNGTLTVNHTERKIWSAYNVEALPDARCTLRHQIWFSAKPAAQKDAMKEEVGTEMREALELIRSNLRVAQKP